MIAIMSSSLESLFRDARAVVFGKGKPVFHSGDPVRSMFMVDLGEAVLTRHTGNGARVTLQRAGPGEVLAEASAYSRHYHCGAEAGAQTRLKAIPVGVFRDRLAQDRVAAEAWARHLAHSVQSARMKAEIRTLKTVAERLDAWLDGGRAVPARGHRQELAHELGVTREALYRELARRRDT
jgi:CRP-like cAMP-binding protein